jgi:hypothetical protein
MCYVQQRAALARKVLYERHVCACSLARVSLAPCIDSNTHISINFDFHSQKQVAAEVILACLVLVHAYIAAVPIGAR